MSDTSVSSPSADVGPSMTVGAQLRASPAVRAAIEAIVRETGAASRRLTDVRPPHPGLSESYDSLLERCAQVRGRGLLYPYLGSGVGNGALVELADGSVKWDMIGGIGVHFFGHSHPVLVEAAAEAALDDVVKSGNLQSSWEAYQFGEVLLSMASRGSRLKHAYVATSGAMANENALKVCYQKHAPASRVLCFKDCFMGRSITMCQIGDSPDYRQGIPLSTLVDYMPFWDAAAAERMGPGGKTRFINMAVDHLLQYIHRYPGQHACFIFEMCQGEGGFNVGDRDFLKALIDVCKAHKIAVWDDEIQTFGRLPRMFAYEQFDLGEYVDVFCVGKMTQACATLYTEEYNPRAGLLSGTFTGEGVSFRVGIKVLEMLRDGPFYGPDGSFARHHAIFREHAAAMIARRPEWFPPVPALGQTSASLAGGIGGMMRLTPFGGDKAKITAACKACYEQGVILFQCGHGPYHLRLLPPLPVMNEADWPRVFACIERGLAQLP